MTKSNQSRRTRRKHTAPQRNAWKLRSPGIHRLRNTRRVQFANEPITSISPAEKYLRNEGLVITGSEFSRALSERHQIDMLLQEAGIKNKHISNSNMVSGSFKLQALYEYDPLLKEAEMYIHKITQRYTSISSSITNNTLKNELFALLQRAIAYYNRANQSVQKFLKSSMNEKVYLPIKDYIVDNADASIVESQTFLELLNNKNSKAKALAGNNNVELNEY
jgi:hypothetical protein